MTIVSITGVAPGSASTSPAITIPTVQDGDRGVALFHANSATVTFTPPTGWTRIAALGPLSGNNCQTYLCTKNTPFAAADSGTTLTGTFTSPAPRYGVLLAVFRGVAIDGTPVGMSDDTADTTLVFGNMFTPTGNNENAVILAGITTTSAQGAYTVTPPSGWTEDVDLNGAYASASNTGVWAGRISLTGGAGSAHSIGNATATKNVRMNAWAIPLAPIVNVSTAAVAATASYAPQAPAVSGETIITGGGAAHATNAMSFPSQVFGEAAVSATAATAAGKVNAPSITANAPPAVTAVRAQATSAAIAPALHISSAVTASAVTATAAARAPVVGAHSVAITASPLIATTTARRPSITATGAGTVLYVRIAGTWTQRYLYRLTGDLWVPQTIKLFENEPAVLTTSPTLATSPTLLTSGG